MKCYIDAVSKGKARESGTKIIHKNNIFIRLGHAHGRDETEMEKRK